MASKAIPILVTGRTEKVAAVVIAALKPEYEVIHFTQADACREEIPLLLKGQLPASPSSTLGSGNWNVFPRALLLGGAYQDDDVTELRRLASEKPGTKQIPWLRVDSTKPAPPPGPEYGKLIVERAKALLKKLDEEGKLGEGDDTVHFF